MIRNRFRCPLALLALILAALSGLGSAQRADAHAAFERSDPAPNAILATSPAQVTVWFVEPLEMGYSSATLFDQRGEAVPSAVSGPGPNDHSLTLPIPTALPNGTYSVAWKTLSAADGHTANAYFAFTVGTAADVTAVVAPDTASAGTGSLWRQTLGRWLSLLGLVGAVAVWPVWVVVLQPAVGAAGLGGAGDALAGRMRRLAWGAIGLAVVGDVAALLVQAEQLPAGGAWTRLRETLTDTRYGELWVLRVGLLALLAAALLLVSWEEPRRRPWRTGLALAAAAVLPLPVSLNAHASALDRGRAAAIAADLVHVVSASLWAGGVALLLLVALVGMRGAEPTARRAVLAASVPRFSALALVAWATLALTGLYSAWLHVGNPTGLRETDYGRSLTVKLLLIVPILALAAVNLLVVSRRMGRVDPADRGAWARRLAVALSAEVALAVVVLLVVGRLTSQQPARDALAQATAGVSIGLGLGDRTGTLELTPGAAGPNAYRLTVDGEVLPPDAEGLLRIELAGATLGEKEIPLVRGPGNTFDATGSELSTAGDWSIQVIVRKIGAFQYTATVRQAVGLTPVAASDLPGPAWRFETSAIAGLAFLVAGMGGWVVGWRAGRRPLRKEAAGLGTVLVAMGVLLVLAGRTPSTASAQANPIPADAASLARGEASFLVNCASCHGAAGRGDGPAAAGLDPAPTNLTAGHGLMHDDAELFALVSEGKIGTAMPTFRGALTENEIWDLVNWIRQLQGSQGSQGSQEGGGGQRGEGR